MAETAVSMKILNNKELAKYIKELDEDVKLDIYNLREKALMSSAIWSKWLSYLYHEKENADRIVETKQKYIAKKTAASKNLDSVLRLKNEEKLLSLDETLKKLNKLAKITQDNIEYIERALTILSNFGFLIKNVTEICKLNMTH